MNRTTPLIVLSAVVLLLTARPHPLQAQNTDTTESPTVTTTPPPSDGTMQSDVPFVRSPKEIVIRMLDLANVTANDTVYDLGSGDGRIPITAAQRYGARAVGIEIKPYLVEEARERAEQTVVEDLVEFRHGDLFEADFSEASVVTLYLLPDVNKRLRPLLFKQLEPGTRVVSHGFDMGAWEADKVVRYEDTFLYLWTIPEEIPTHLRE